MSNKNYNEDTARKPNVILVASYVHSIVHAPSTHAHQSRRQHNSSSTTTAFPPYKLGVLLRASSTSSRPVLRSPKFRLYKRHKYEIPKLPQNNSTKKTTNYEIRRIQKLSPWQRFTQNRNNTTSKLLLIWRYYSRLTAFNMMPKTSTDIQSSCMLVRRRNLTDTLSSPQTNQM